MNEQDVRELGRRFVEDYAGGGKAEAAEDLLDVDFTAYVPARPDPIRGRDAHVAMNASWHEALPDFAFDFDAIAVDGDQVVVRFSWTGTTRGNP